MSGADFTVKLGTQYVRGDRASTGVAIAGGRATIESRGTYVVPAGTQVTSGGTTNTYTASTAVFLQVGDVVVVNPATAKVIAPQYLLDLLDDDSNLDDDAGLLTPSEITDEALEDLQLTRMLFEGLYGRYADADYDFITPLLASVATRNRFHKDIYVFAGNNDGSNGHSSFVALPFYMEIEAQRRRSRVQGVIDAAVAVDDGVTYDDAKGQLIFADGGRRFVVSNLTSDPIGTMRVTRAAFTVDGAHLQVFFGEGESGGSVLLPVGTQYASILPYTVIAMAREDTHGCGMTVQDYCIVAPGSYKYNDKVGGVYGHDDNDLADSAVSNDAAAALVSGGIALLQQIFDDQMASSEIVERLFKTASQGFAGYDAARHGQGMLDLECAVRPTFSAEESRCRFSTVGRSKEDCVTQGWGYDIAKRECVSPTAEQCAAADAVFRGGRCVVTGALCIEAGLILDDGGRLCGEPMSAVDCVGPVNQIFNQADMNRCVALPTDCDTDEAVRAVSGGMACRPKAEVCMGTEGYLASRKICGVPTAVADCAGLTNQIFNAGDTNSCVADVTGCDSGEMVRNNNECVGASMTCTGSQGFNDATRMCVSNPTAAQCVAVGRFLHSTAANGCVATCLANEASSTTAVGSVVAGTCFSRTLCPSESNQGYDASNMMCVAGTAATCFAAGTASYFLTGTGCVTASNCGANNAAVRGSSTATCQSRSTACTGAMTGLRNNVCVTPTGVSDCGGGVPIYNPSGMGNACVAAATDCDADEAVVSNVCTAKATACTGTNGYRASTQTCGVPTSAMDCAGLTNQIYNERTGTNACVAAATDCDADEAVVSNVCTAKATACTGTQGYIASTQTCGEPMQAADCTGLTNSIYDADSGGNTCVAVCPAREGLMTGTNQSCVAAGSATAEQCVNAGRVRLAAGTGCAAMCSANNAPASGQCGVATTVCTATQGYNTATRLCVASPNEAQCRALSRVRLSGGNCATQCGANNAPTSLTNRQCIAATSACSGTQGYNAGTRLCVANPNEAQCRALSRVRLSGGNCATQCGANNAPTSLTNRQCIAATTACSGTQGYNAGTRLCVANPNEAQCRALSRVRLSGGNCAAMCGANNAPTSLTNSQCIAATTACTGAQGYDSGMRTCVSNPTAAQCVAVSRLLHSTAANGCVATCLANEASSTTAVGSVVAGTCFSRTLCPSDSNQGYDALSRMCVAGTAATCFAAGSAAYFRTGMGCVTASNCGVNNAAVRGSSMATCQSRLTACTGTMTGLRNNVCVTPTHVSDCGGGVPIYDARTGGNVCVATAQDCEADKVLVNSNTCTPKAMACTGSEGYLSATRLCGVPTSAADCAGLTNGIFNADSGGNECVAACPAGDGLMTGATQSCVAAASATAQQCLNAKRVRLQAGTACAAMCGANNAPNTSGQCGEATSVCTGSQGYNALDRVCVSAANAVASHCQALSKVLLFDVRAGCADMCIADNAPLPGGQCFLARAVCAGGAQGYDRDTRSCLAADSVDEVADCAVFESNNRVKNVYRPSVGCVTASACRGSMGAVNQNECVTASARTCFNDEGRGFETSSCATASSSTCMAGVFTFDTTNSRCIVALSGLTGITSEATAKAIFTADTSSVTHESSLQQRIAKEYQNQPTLAQVKAADAYARGADASTTSTYDLNLGQGSTISVLTNTRFDPTHPEFSSSHSDASYDTLTRFWLQITAGSIGSIEDFIPSYFSKDDDELVHVYNDHFNDRIEAYMTIPVPVLNDGMNVVAFETISRDDFDGNAAIRASFLTFIQGLVGGTRVTQTPLIYHPEFKYLIPFGFDMGASIFRDEFYLEIERSNSSSYTHIGRIYGEASNIASYQAVVSVLTAFHDKQGKLADDISTLTLASDADMGLLALINGLLDPARSDSAAELNANTHGIAPLASMDVFTSFKANESGFNGSDLMYRARGIDLSRNRDDDGALIADDDRNIVLVQNTVAHKDRVEAATQAHINEVVGVASGTIDDSYKSLYDALKVGVADTAEQDIYVFAAEDGRSNDAGLLASLAAAQESGDRLFADYSIVVVAAGAGSRTPCGSVVADFCITAPGAYTYIDKESGRDANAYDDTDVLVAASVTANAAASLVAGGLAVLESIFGDQLKSSQLIDRLLSTASQNFDLDGTAGNDYTTSGSLTAAQQYGVGLMDLAAASLPIMGSNSPTDFEEQSGSRERVDYCDIEGLRIILSGDLCSDDHIQIVDADGNMIPDAIGKFAFWHGLWRCFGWHSLL